jgi:lysine 2,3-aminomutase
LLGTLRAIPHVEVLRIGSRAPVTLPMRVTPELTAMLKRHRPLWFNTQFNHVEEITPESIRACERLLMAGIPVSNQSVLLKGINDDYETMRDLLIGLERISVRPYYLFQCEPVRGVNHFRADICKRSGTTSPGSVSPGMCRIAPVAGVKSPFSITPLLTAREAGINKHSFDKIGRID